MSDAFDGVIIGAGPNGLVAANVLADHGWSVVVLEAEETPGGGVRSAETLDPGFVVDLFSAFYPMTIVSPSFQRLDLGSHGLEWSHAPDVLAHPTLDGPAVIVSRDIERTARSLDQFRRGDGAAWQELYGEFARIEEPLIAAIMGPFPPVRAGARLAGHLGVRGLGQFARTALLPVRRLAEERFGGAGGGLLLAGNALHTDLAPEAAASAFFGLLLAAIAQGHGWPVPRGGAQGLTDALVRRLESKGGVVRCSSRVAHVVERGGRAVGVVVGGAATVEANRAVIADVVAPSLYRDLLDQRIVPAPVRGDIDRYQRAAATFKVNWALDRPAPWTDPQVTSAGTVHLAASLDELTMTMAQTACGMLPSHPFMLIGQMTTADATRSPAGTESMWAYTSLPQEVKGDAGGEGIEGRWADRASGDGERFADRMEARIEEFAPGFQSHIRSRQIQSPHDLEAADANLLGGDKNLGTAHLHQQLIFRPTIGLSRPETFLDGLYLGSASAHPGGGVHGACGANAAQAALLHDRMRRVSSTLRRAVRR
ncbi:MAG: NAD(P)/FAD-dependent oxidoreductase [Acidimicrobiia bacterium]|nr:NAD(P)/FAD-dependent oxidoreductase [Acidimicrobiia bacterium]